MQLADYDYNKYNSWCDLYDRLMLAGYYDYDAFVDNLASVIKECSFRSCLEIGVGTGLVASKLAQRTELDLLGIDFSEGMVEVCQRNFPDIKTVVGDISEFDFSQTYDLVFSVGGPWYFMQRDDELIFCSHLPELEVQARSIKNVCQAMHQGSVLALAIQGPHVNLSRKIDETLNYSQDIRIKSDAGDIFEKDYIFEEHGDIISKQTCLFRLSDRQSIEAEFKRHGLEPFTIANCDNFVLYRKA